MKTFLKTGKKTLSLFMAVVMMITAMVFVAPEKASAEETASNEFVEIGDVKHFLSSTPSSSTAATCTQKGTETYKCVAHDDCGVVVTVETELAQHKIKTEASETETCTSEGKVKTYCENCNLLFSETSTPKAQHNFGEWETIQTAGPDEWGIKKRVCGDCKYTEYDAIEPTGDAHDFLPIVTPSTCTVNGTKVYTCKKHENCKANYTETLPLEDHKFEKYDILSKADCINGEVRKYTCSDCDAEKTEVIGSGSGVHNWTDTYVAPTCTEVGYTIKACKGCGLAYRTDFVASTGHNYTYSYSDATCTKDGGTTYTCTNSGCKYSYFVADENAPALGHDMTSWYYEAQNGGEYYYNKRDCGRDECAYCEYEKNANSEDVQKYFKVDYINEWKATETFVAADGTILAYDDEYGTDSFKKHYTTENVASIFVKEGEAAKFPNKVYPQRLKTKAYGKYLLSWKVKSGSETAENVTSNMTLTADYTGTDNYYKVRFYNSNGTALTKEQVILHGHSAQYPFEAPTTAENVHYKYEFSHWDRDFSEIYSDGGIVAIYNAIPKTYYVVYHDYDGNVISEGSFNYMTKPDCTPTNAQMAKASDKMYNYSFRGWAKASGESVDVNALTVPSNYVEYDPNLKDNTDEDVYNKYMTDAEKGIIHLYPSYLKKAISYKFRIVAIDVDGYPIPGAAVQVLDSNQQLRATGNLNEDSELILGLTYSETYTVTVTYANNAASFSYSGDTLVALNENGNIPTVRVQLEKGSDFNGTDQEYCTCICHSFFSRFWITFCNLVYRLFGKKIVCCYDFYALHGDDIVYGK